MYVHYNFNDVTKMCCHVLLYAIAMKIVKGSSLSKQTSFSMEFQWILENPSLKCHIYVSQFNSSSFRHLYHILSGLQRSFGSLETTLWHEPLVSEANRNFLWLHWSNWLEMRFGTFSEVKMLKIFNLRASRPWGPRANRPLPPPHSASLSIVH